MILFARAGRLAFWLEQDPGAHPLACDVLDRRALRAELDGLLPGGDATLLLDGDGLARHLDEAGKAVQEFSVWAEVRLVRPRVVLLSSDCVYGILNPGVALREQDAAGADEASRAMLALEAELDARAQRRGFGFAVARLFELVDARAPSDRLIDLAGRVREGRMKAVPELGATRDYLDARDAARAVRALAGLSCSATVNVCSGRALSGHELVRELVRLLRPADEGALMAQVEPDGGKLIPWIVGNPARFAQVVGGPAATTPFSETLQSACGLL